MNTLQLALQSRVPLISVTTTDPINAPDIITRLAMAKVGVMHALDIDNYIDKDGKLIKGDDFYDIGILYPHGEIIGNYEDIYEFASLNNFCFVLLNTEYSSPLFLEVGEIPVPKQMILERLELVAPKDPLADIMAAVGGLDLKTITEILKITQVRDGTVTAEGVISTRKNVVPGITGITQLDTKMPFYEPSASLCEWIEGNAEYIKSETIDARLRPKGLLFNGDPGCGKTQGAKYIADNLKLPLYLLDVAGLLNRFHGESENNLIRALARIDEESPCVVLMDEVEKLFGGVDEGTTNRLLAKLLWWLQERTSNALIIMTCNDIDKIPKELYREGRIDRVLEFSGLKTVTESERFVNNMLGTFEGYKKPDKALVKDAVKTLLAVNKEAGVAHSKLAQLAEDLIKQVNL
ncbi:AAA+ ATPase domain protein [Vibrio phage 1.215.B._10N.222.54.F7]|nr:AAA+ ATPase domain protein [Vibrio phage 1.215.A._10N.222.54.F7]AUR96111.1 AAA+ ATPase domain protein [Vibrio phage 1.215.B._10N.222.54.F7]